MSLDKLYTKWMNSNSQDDLRCLADAARKRAIMLWHRYKIRKGIRGVPLEEVNSCFNEFFNYAIHNFRGKDFSIFFAVFITYRFNDLVRKEISWRTIKLESEFNEKFDTQTFLDDCFPHKDAGLAYDKLDHDRLCKKQYALVLEKMHVLSETQRSVLQLRYQNDLPHSKIEEILNIKSSKDVLFHALKKLRDESLIAALKELK